jgi:hypothetical protein
MPDFGLSIRGIKTGKDSATQEDLMRKILNAIKAALRAMMRALGGAWAALVGGGGGEDVVIDDDHEPVDAPSENSVVNEPDPMADYKERLEMQRQAAAIITYACDADVDGKRPVTAPCLTRLQKSWLGGLGAGDLRLIADSDRESVCSHIGSGPFIHSLLQVQELPPLVLQPLMVRGRDDEMAAGEIGSTPTFLHWIKPA